MDDQKRYAQGMKVRRAVLSDAHVDRSLAKRTEFNADFQDFITRYAWGDIWSRPGLDRKSRSCVVLSITIALGRWDEFKLHIKGAVNNGLTETEIKEVIMQAAIYAGVPAANTAMHMAEELLNELKSVAKA